MAVERPEPACGADAPAQANGSDARPTLAAQQEALVRALTCGADPPTGFDAVRIARTAQALLQKRCRSAGRAWPALAAALGEQFRPLFAAYAQAEPIPPGGTPLEDGYAFALHLQRGGWLPEPAKLEFMLARCRRGWPMRCGLLRRPLRLAVAARLPRRHVRWCLVWLGSNRSYPDAAASR